MRMEPGKADYGKAAGEVGVVASKALAEVCGIFSKLGIGNPGPEVDVIIRMRKTPTGWGTTEVAARRLSDKGA